MNSLPFLAQFITQKHIELSTHSRPKPPSLWQAAKGAFTFKVQPPDNYFSFTKRNFLSKVSTLFDPLGFLAPFIIKDKVLLQDLWAAGLDWDDPFGETLVCRSRNWFEELPKLAQINVPQCLQPRNRNFLIPSNLCGCF